MAQKKTKASKGKRSADSENPTDLPEGWFVLEAGNTVQGILGDHFTVKGKFGPKEVYKIKITSGETRVIDGEDEVSTISTGVVGVDQKGFLNGLAEVPSGTKVFIRCNGKDAPTEEYPNGAWRFDLAVPKGTRLQPPAAKRKRVNDSRGKSDEGEDDIPF